MLLEKAVLQMLSCYPLEYGFRDIFMPPKCFRKIAHTP
jgi:hypothetical protein